MLGHTPRRRHSGSVISFAFSSTMLIHRPAEPGEFITEDWPIEPTWAYPESKVRTEQMIHDERGEIPTGTRRNLTTEIACVGTFGKLLVLGFVGAATTLTDAP